MRRSLHLLVIFDAVFLALSLPDATKEHASRYYVAAAILNLVVLIRAELQRRQIRTLNKSEDETADRADGSLTQWVRTNGVLHFVYRAIGDGLVPALCGAGLVYLLAAGINRVAFDLASGSGKFCHSTIPDTAPAVTKAVTTPVFETKRVCWASGRALAAQTRYRVIIENTQANWTDGETPTDTRGFKASTIKYALATPLKRWWREPWFVPVARVGKAGNQEFALQPCVFPPPEERNILVAEFTPQTAGELFLFVNDAVLAIPGHGNYFYKNNQGTASVTIEQVHDDGTSKYHAFCPK